MSSSLRDASIRDASAADPASLRPIPLQEVEAVLAKTPFRARFRLTDRDLAYLRRRGGSVVREHAARFVRERLAPAQPLNDGRQTPWRGHPVFVAQHATATCCRTCLARVHGIAAGQALSAAEQAHCVEAILRWLAREYRRAEAVAQA